MKIGQFTKWNFKNGFIGMMVFYAVYLGVISILNIILTMQFGIGDETVSTTISAGIYFFVIGIVYSHHNMRVGLANSISRKSIFNGTILAALLLSILAAIINFAAGRIITLLNTQSVTLYEWLSSSMYLNQPSNGVIYILAYLLNGIVTSLLAFLTGWFIGSAYYRMNRGLKIAVSIGVPALLFIGLPILSAQSSAFSAALSTIFKTILNFVTLSPFYLTLFLLALCVVFTLLSWLLLRRAPVKATFS